MKEINALRLRLSDHEKAGRVLRDRAKEIPLDAHEKCKTWKVEELEWADELFDIVRAIDPAAVEEVEALHVLDHRIAHKLPASHPLRDDPDSSLDFHNTRVRRVVPMLIKRFAEATSQLISAAPSAPAKGKRRGRKKGDGSFDEFDKPLIERALNMIAEVAGMNANKAATILAPEAHGSGTEESKKTRLYRKILDAVRAQK